MSTDPLAGRCLWAGCERDRVPGTVRCTFHTPSDFDLDDDYADVSSVLFDRAPKSSTRLHAFTPEQLAAHDAQVRADERQKVEAEVRELRAELEHPALGLSAWRAVAAQRLVRAEKAEEQVRGFQQMRRPEEAHRLQQQWNEARRIAETAESELTRIRALLADEGAVETVAEALSEHDDQGSPLAPSAAGANLPDLPGWTCDDDDRLVYECLCGDRSPALDQDYIGPDDAETAGAWHRAHVASAALDVLAGLIGGDDA